MKLPTADEMVSGQVTSSLDQGQYFGRKWVERYERLPSANSFRRSSCSTNLSKPFITLLPTKRERERLRERLNPQQTPPFHRITDLPSLQTLPPKQQMLVFFKQKSTVALCWFWATPPFLPQLHSAASQRGGVPRVLLHTHGRRSRLGCSRAARGLEGAELSQRRAGGPGGACWEVGVGFHES